MRTKKKVVILGAGPTGLSAAYELAKLGHFDVEVVEREAEVGGIATTFRHGEFALDVGTHRLYAGMHADTLDWIRGFIGDDLLDRRRNCKILLMDQLYRYPPKPTELLSKMGLKTPALFLADFAMAKARGDLDLSTYEGHMVQRFGRYFYDIFYRPYAEKVWGLPMSKLSSDQAQKRVNALSMKDVVVKTMTRKIVRPNYFYPKSGMGYIWDRVAEELSRLGVTIHRSTSVVGFSRSGNRVRSVVVEHGAGQQELPCDELMTTIPLTRFLGGVFTTDSVTRLAGGLRYRALVVFYLVLAKPFASEHETYYVPSTEFPFNRVFEPKNYSPSLGPRGRTCLGLEITCDVGDETWRMSDSDRLEQVLPGLAKLGLVRRDEVTECFSKRIETAYPLYEVGYRDTLTRLLSEAQKLENAISNGRQGLFIHQNIHHSIEMGQAAARHVASGSPSSVWYSSAIRAFDAFKVFD
ncbi:MAG: FAD-dependent oxidoreductase [Deltaproteobacteria bacterium]|nr:FAD-dependent oxidoreductase [Deltaproteobacteria bacterium]